VINESDIAFIESDTYPDEHYVADVAAATLGRLAEIEPEV
jgi:hypothetical protein